MSGTHHSSLRLIEYLLIGLNPLNPSSTLHAEGVVYKYKSYHFIPWTKKCGLLTVSFRLDSEDSIYIP